MILENVPAQDIAEQAAEIAAEAELEAETGTLQSDRLPRSPG